MKRRTIPLSRFVSTRWTTPRLLTVGFGLGVLGVVLPFFSLFALGLLDSFTPLELGRAIPIVFVMLAILGVCLVGLGFSLWLFIIVRYLLDGAAWVLVSVPLKAIHRWMEMGGEWQQRLIRRQGRFVGVLGIMGLGLGLWAWFDEQHIGFLAVAAVLLWMGFLISKMSVSGIRKMRFPMFLHSPKARMVRNQVVLFVCLAVIMLGTKYYRSAREHALIYYYKNAIIGDARLKTELYRYERGRLPGLREVLIDEEYWRVSASTGALEQGALQAVWGNPDGDPNVASTYLPGIARYDERQGLMVSAVNPEEEGVVHVAISLHLEMDELNTHRFAKPTDIFYQAFESDNGYLFVWGVFGGGRHSRLPAGTSCALIDLRNTSVAEEAGEPFRAIGTWRRASGRGLFQPPRRQVALLSAFDAAFDPALVESWEDVDICWIGDPRALLSDDMQEVEAELDRLRRAGWRL